MPAEHRVITLAEAERLEAIAAKATPGPWEADLSVRVLAPQRKFKATPQHPEFVVAQCGTFCSSEISEAKANQKLITESRTALPSLIAQHRKVMELLLEVNLAVQIPSVELHEKVEQMIREWRGQ